MSKLAQTNMTIMEIYCRSEVAPITPLLSLAEGSRILSTNKPNSVTLGQRPAAAPTARRHMRSGVGSGKPCGSAL